MVIGDVADQGEQKSSSHKADEFGEQRSAHNDDQQPNKQLMYKDAGHCPNKSRVMRRRMNEWTANQTTKLPIKDRSKSEFTMLQAKSQQKSSDDICDPGANQEPFVITQIKKGRKSEL
jgi:hypothetical protein